MTDDGFLTHAERVVVELLESAQRWGLEPTTRITLRRALADAGFDGSSFASAIAVLVRSGEVEEVRPIRNGVRVPRSYTEYRLRADEDWEELI